jgi:hypothetical protein
VPFTSINSVLSLFLASRSYGLFADMSCTLYPSY